jgi:hypothetical protein
MNWHGLYDTYSDALDAALEQIRAIPTNEERDAMKKALLRLWNERRAAYERYSKLATAEEELRDKLAAMGEGLENEKEILEQEGQIRRYCRMLYGGKRPKPWRLGLKLVERDVDRDGDALDVTGSLSGSRRKFVGHTYKMANGSKITTLSNVGDPIRSIDNKGDTS